MIRVVTEIDLPGFGLWNWEKDDYKSPLIMKPEENTDIKLFLQPLTGNLKKLESFIKGQLEIEFHSPSKALVRGLKSATGKNSKFAAEKIYNFYATFFQRFEVLLLTTGNVKNLMIFEGPKSLESFYDSGLEIFGSKVTWYNDKEGPFNFRPRIAKDRRKRLAVFRAPQLITTKKWGEIQQSINNAKPISAEIIELLKIRAKTLWRDKKTPLLESAILIETLLRDYVRTKLLARGYSKNKINDLKDEFTFNNVLNLIFPTTLTNGQLIKIQKSIDQVNTLRKLRNDVIHGEKGESEIDGNIVINGIEGALRIFSHISKHPG